MWRWEGLDSGERGKKARANLKRMEKEKVTKEEYIYTISILSKDKRNYPTRFLTQ